MTEKKKSTKRPVVEHDKSKTNDKKKKASNQFIGLDHADHYTHLSTFYELTAIMGFEERDKEAAYMRLFPFLLAGKAKDWLNSHSN